MNLVLEDVNELVSKDVKNSIETVMIRGNLVLLGECIINLFK